jgi:hypothetical protein
VFQKQLDNLQKVLQRFEEACLELNSESANYSRRCFLGLCTYYRRFADIVKPMTQLM